MQAAIAQHLNIAQSDIAEIQEWASVLWVRVANVGCRFVSKKVVKVKNVETKLEIEIDKQPSRWVIRSSRRIEAKTASGFEVVSSWVSIDKKGNIQPCYGSSAGMEKPSQELLDRASELRDKCVAEYAPKRRIESDTITVKLRSSVFNEALTAVKKSGGKYNGNNKTWSIERNQFNSRLMFICSDLNDDLEYAMYDPNGRYYG